MSKFNLINELLLEVNLGNEKVFAKKGSMVACRGEVGFRRSFLTGSGIQEMAMRSVTNEGFEMMAANGKGQVYYAWRRLYVTVIPLAGETFYVESESVLVFDQHLRPGTAFLGNRGLVQGMIQGAVTGQGLFTSTFQGNGELAILSDGFTIALDVTPNKPIYVDPDAYIGHRGELNPKFVTDVNWKTFIGQSSGESYQLQFNGTGTVYIQASER